MNFVEILEVETILCHAYLMFYSNFIVEACTT